jgi:putative spermidine/putrescine transport system substrate-binding protein
MKFIAFSTMAIPQARAHDAGSHTAWHTKSADYVSPKQLSAAGAPATVVHWLTNYDWWVDNRDTVIGRWNKWILA